MLLIPCPYCGKRAEAEFAWGGEADLARPPLDCSDEEWALYLFFRRNPRGAVRERWVHSAGCRQWFLVERDTVTNEIAASRPIGGGAS